MADKFDLLIDRIDDIKDTVDDSSADIKDIKVEVARNTADVKVHIHRTNLAEERLKLLEDRFTFTYLFKGITGIGALAGAGYAVIKLLKYIGL